MAGSIFTRAGIARRGPSHGRRGSPLPNTEDFTKMEAERINYVNNLCEDLAHRLAELRGYL